MNDSLFLHWVADRLVLVYEESEDVDFVGTLRRIATDMEEKEKALDRMRAELEGKSYVN